MESRNIVKRTDERIQTKATAILVGGDGRLDMEMGITENVSCRGARVITNKCWNRNDMILLSLPGFRFTSAVRVAYCDVLMNGQFGTGLEFKGPAEDLKITAAATAIEFPR